MLARPLLTWLVPLVLTMMLVATAAVAHPGHGAPGQAQTLLHYLNEPIHVLGALAVAFIVISGASALRRWRHALSKDAPRRLRR